MIMMKNFCGKYGKFFGVMKTPCLYGNIQMLSLSFVLLWRDFEDFVYLSYIYFLYEQEENTIVWPPHNVSEGSLVLRKRLTRQLFTLNY